MSMFHHEIDGGKSSNIHWARYNEAAQTLQIDFKDKDGKKVSTYEYANVPLEVFEGMKASQKRGEFFAYRIRGRFEYRKIATAQGTLL